MKIRHVILISVLIFIFGITSGMTFFLSILSKNYVPVALGIIALVLLLSLLLKLVEDCDCKQEAKSIIKEEIEKRKER